MGEITYLKTKAEFDQALADAGDKLVVVDFTASWCGPCQRIAPKFKELRDKYPNAVFYKVDVDDNDETSEANGIQAMPTFICFKNTKKVDSLRGANEAGLETMIKKNL